MVDIVAKKNPNPNPNPTDPSGFWLGSTGESGQKQHEKKTKLRTEEDYFFAFSDCRQSKLGQ